MGFRPTQKCAVNSGFAHMALGYLEGYISKTRGVGRLSSNYPIPLDGALLEGANRELRLRLDKQ
jgi:hypothetical protein